MASGVPFDDLNVTFDDIEVTFDGINQATSRPPSDIPWTSGNGVSSGK